jgi:hypothetical protein
VVDPFEGFPAGEYQLDATGGGATPIFQMLFEALEPQFVIEVGSWKGMSALWMGNWLRAHNVCVPLSAGGSDGACMSVQPSMGLDFHPLLLCIDTWLGAPELYQVEASGAWGIQGKRKYGRPQIYEQFLANVILTELTDYILPFATTSSAAARWLLMKGFAEKADLIYIDGAHDEPDVMRDLIDYWELLKPGGALFGDDYDQNWTGVVKAVDRFAGMKKVSLEIIAGERKWVIWKR